MFNKLQLSGGDMAEDIQPAKQGFLILADHPALDILNTVPMIAGELTDMLQSDADVLRWLEVVGLPAARSMLKPLALLHGMRTLREMIRSVIEKRKAGKKADVTALNEFLAKGQSYLSLLPEKNGALRVHREWEQRTAEQVLAPLAEMAATFIAEADFGLVRRCEDAHCVLWFYDRTRSHHRRWCSMATCGNRHKVAAFRERKALG
jgi:predicted RNA-binding Zn ribbon-like protein